jgi:hypothetical protein
VKLELGFGDCLVRKWSGNDEGDQVFDFDYNHEGSEMGLVSMDDLERERYRDWEGRTR